MIQKNKPRVLSLKDDNYDMASVLNEKKNYLLVIF